MTDYQDVCTLVPTRNEAKTIDEVINGLYDISMRLVLSVTTPPSASSRSATRASSSATRFSSAVGTEEGMTIRFDESEVRTMGRSARGVRGIDLEDQDRVAGMVAVAEDSECDLLTVTKKGYGKRTPIAEYRTQSRYGKGLIDIKTGERNGPASSLEAVEEDDHLIVMSESGQIMRTRVSDVSEQGRNTMGVIVMRHEDADRVASVDVLPAERAEE